MSSLTFIKNASVHPENKLWPSISMVIIGIVATLFVPTLVSIAIGYLLLLVLIMVIGRGMRWSPRVVFVVIIFFLMIAAGLTHSAGYKLYDVFKDIWYFSFPCAMIMIGYLCGNQLNDKVRVFNTFLSLGFISSLIHLSHFVVNPELITEPATTIRTLAGTGYYAVGIAFVLGLYRLRDCSRSMRDLTLIIMFFCGSSLLLSFSRSMDLMVFIMILGYYGKLDLLKYARARLVIGILLACLVVVIQLIPQSHLSQNPTFIDKILHSAHEIQIEDYSSFEKINTNWRGFETAKALEDYADSGIDVYLLGHGLGHLVDLGFYMNLSNEPGQAMRYIPVLHNGYAYLLVKTGLVGVVLYFYLLWWLIKTGGASVVLESGLVTSEGRLIISLSLAVLIATSLISGLFNRSDFVPIELLLGALLSITDNHKWKIR